jgi:methionyl aminopeptidase
MIHVRSQREIELIKHSCSIVVETFRVIEALVKPGVTTVRIDEIVDDYIRSQGARPAFKGYDGFPASACISVESEVVHGIPGNRELREGEIVSIDIGAECEGYFGDSARTFAVGEIDFERQRLMDVTLESLEEGVLLVEAGQRLSNISHRIQTIVEGAGFSVVRDLVGHGIGRNLHEDPQIPNYGKPHSGPRLRAGMVLAIEPMVNMGGYRVLTKDDNWTVVTEDGSASAHFEYTVAVTNDGCEILTKYE